MPGSPGTVPRYMLPVMVGVKSGWRRGEGDGVEQSGCWCSRRGCSMPYGVMCMAKGPTARCSLWSPMSLRRATARVWERPSLIHTVSARDAARLRQSVMMPVIVRLWVASDTLMRGALMRGMVCSSWREPALRLALSRCWASWVGVCMPVCFGFLLGRSAVWKGVGQEGGVMEGGLWEVPPCCPCVQGGRGGPLHLYGVSLVVSAMGNEDVGGPRLIHLCGVGEVAGDGDLGGVVLPGGSVGDDVMGRPFVVGCVFRRVYFEVGVERFQLATQVGGHPWRPPAGTPRTDTHPPHLPPGVRSSPSATRHTHPGVMGIRHTHKPTSSRGHQDRTIHPTGPDPNPIPQHPTRLHHLVGISRPRHPQPPTSPPPPPPRPLDTNTTALLEAAATAATKVGAPVAWSPQYLVETKVAPHGWGR